VLHCVKKMRGNCPGREYVQGNVCRAGQIDCAFIYKSSLRRVHGPTDKNIGPRTNNSVSDSIAAVYTSLGTPITVRVFIYCRHTAVHNKIHVCLLQFRYVMYAPL